MHLVAADIANVLQIYPWQQAPVTSEISLAYHLHVDAVVRDLAGTA